MNYRTYRELMLEKLSEAFPGHGTAFTSIRFQKWTGWKTPTQPILVQSYLAMERLENGVIALYIIRAYADDESETAWRDFFAFDQAGNICTLSELIAEIKDYSEASDPDYPLDVTEYDTLIENLTELVANDALLRSCRA